MGDKEVLKYDNVVLRESDLDTLRGPCFLNDQIIAFYFSYLSASCATDDILLVAPCVSFCLANCEDEKIIGEIAVSYKLSSKRLVIFAVNDCDLKAGDSGSHWSILVYDRTKNAFLHHDSMQGLNADYAEKLYNAVKNYMGLGGEASRPKTSSSKKQRNNKKNKGAQSASKPEVDATAPACLPIFKECQTPQQTNGYDCGLYVLAIAKAICENNSKTDVLSAIGKYVDDSVEVKMREKVLDIIRGLRNN